MFRPSILLSGISNVKIFESWVFSITLISLNGINSFKSLGSFFNSYNAPVLSGRISNLTYSTFVIFHIIYYSNESENKKIFFNEI
jgi:hypothetical protein